MRMQSPFTSQNDRKESRHCSADSVELHTTMQLFLIVTAAVMPTIVFPYSGATPAGVRRRRGER